jgi:hypothetical protein
MGGALCFFRPALQAIEVGLFLTPHYALVAIVGLIVAGVSASRNSASLRGKWVWLLLPFVITAAILAFGVAFNHRGVAGSAPAWRGQVLQAFVWMHVPVALLLLVTLRQVRPVFLGLSAFQLWLSFSASIVSSMSVNNVWL